MTKKSQYLEAAQLKMSRARSKLSPSTTTIRNVRPGYKYNVTIPQIDVSYKDAGLNRLERRALINQKKRNNK